MDFFTREEKEKLETELRELCGRRKEITQRIAEARALGDLKENAEYHSAREDQGLNERKIRELEERINTGQIADDIDIPEDMVFLGATVRLREIETGDVDLYKIVGTASGDFSVNHVEVTTTSPLGQALLKTHVGDTVRVDLPKGASQFEILEIL
jgi:transcription elongation factor GreA